MKNPFKKKSNTLLIAGVAIGAAAASLAYLFLTENGTTVRNQIAGYFDHADEDEEHEEEEDPRAYLHRPAKTPKTDREALLKHEVLHSTPNGSV